MDDLRGKLLAHLNLSAFSEVAPLLDSAELEVGYLRVNILILSEKLIEAEES